MRVDHQYPVRIDASRVACRIEVVKNLGDDRLVLRGAPPEPLQDGLPGRAHAAATGGHDLGGMGASHDQHRRGRARVVGDDERSHDGADAESDHADAPRVGFRLRLAPVQHAPYVDRGGAEAAAGFADRVQEIVRRCGALQ